MKILTIVFLGFILVSSCKMTKYEKAFTKNVDTLLDSKLNNYVRAEQYQKELDRVQHEISGKLDSIRSTKPLISEQDYIFLVAGSFKVHENAINFASALMEIGMPVRILDYQDFKLVTIASYTNIDSAKKAVIHYRKIMHPDVWIFVKR